MVGVALGEPHLRRRFEAVVELVGHPGAELVDEGMGVEAGQRQTGGQGVEPVGLVEIVGDGAIHSRGTGP